MTPEDYIYSQLKQIYVDSSDQKKRSDDVNIFIQDVICAIGSVIGETFNNPYQCLTQAVTILTTEVIEAVNLRENKDSGD